ncbi:MAG: hypothetical protein M5R38_10930, partial [Candidatus Methylomirabilis sp.]|nr:hypothetical protein [Candidatus Methylomirabilis sp.]
MLRRDVALVGLNLNTGELRDFIFEETVPLDHKKRLQARPPQVIARDDACELIWRGGSRWGFNRDLLLNCNGEEFVIVNLTMWTSRTLRTVLTDQKPANGDAARVGRMADQLLCPLFSRTAHTGGDRRGLQVFGGSHLASASRVGR